MIKKILVIYSSLWQGAGERAVVNFVNTLSSIGYEVYLQLFDGRGHLRNLISNKVNMLPFLSQYATYSESLMKEFRCNGFGWMADIREFVHTRNNSPEFEDLPIGEVHERNWEELKKMCPAYTGYDVTVAFTNKIVLKIVAEMSDSEKKIGLVVTDIETRMNYRDSRSTFSRSFFEHEEKYWNKMDKIIAISQQNVHSFSNVYPKLKNKIIAFSLPHDRQGIIKMSSEYIPAEFSSGVFNIFTSARVLGEKGTDILIGAAAILKRMDIAFQWIVAGNTECDIEYKNRILDMHREFELEGYVKFLGSIPNPFPYYKHCDLYVHPSRLEGKSLALDEAKILGCAILATRYPSVTDAITDGLNGVLCDITPESVAYGISELIKNPNLRKKLSESNAVDVEDVFASIEQYRDIIEN